MQYTEMGIILQFYIDMADIGAKVLSIQEPGPFIFLFMSITFIGNSLCKKACRIRIWPSFWRYPVRSIEKLTKYGKF